MQLTLMIGQRISEISSNKAEFDKASREYNDRVWKSGYKKEKNHVSGGTKIKEEAAIFCGSTHHIVKVVKPMSVRLSLVL